jgi:hypothetical protein
MNSNRIQINGVWYVKEDDIQDLPPQPVEESAVTDSLQCTYEVTDWCFEASILLQDDAIDLSDTNGDPWIKVTDKRHVDHKKWKDQDVDSPEWMLGVLEGDYDSMRLAYEIFNNDGIYHFRAFISILIQKGWLKKQ